ncbi:MAG: phosphatase, partial [Lachnospiraceae bacterium]|nr:phosphatase [Lachnospiraceae bacterium]
MNDILDLHTHTIASGHAYSTLYEMARSASDKGLRLYGCSDHGPNMPGGPHYFHFINFKVVPRELFGVNVLMGAELNILDYKGSVDLKPNVLKLLDYGIASLHIPCIQPGSTEENTSALLGVMENPHIQIIGHPDDSRYPLDYQALVAAAKKHHKLLEINSSSLHPKSPRPG